MPNEDATIPVNSGSIATLLVAGLFLVVFPGCKPPKAVSAQPLGSQSATGAPLRPVEPGPLPGFETGGQTSTASDLDPTSTAVDQINAFLLDAQEDLLSHRAQAAAELPTTAEDATTLRTAQPVLDALAVQGATQGASRDTDQDTRQAFENPISQSSGEVVTVSALDEAPSVDLVATPAPNGSAPLDPISPWIKSLLTSASDSDAPLKQHLTLAIVLGMTRPDQPFEPEGLAELTDQEQNLVGLVHRQFQILGKELEAGGDTTAVLASLHELIGQVKAEQPFRISRLALCTGVQDYGVVDAVEPPIFAPRERGGFIWYLELDGVQPRQDEAAGTWYYEFDLRLEMLTRDTGIPVIAPIEGTVRHTASSEVRDFYLRDLFDIPADLQFDWYTTKLTVVERSSGSQAQRSADLLWVPNLAAGDAHMQQHTASASAD
jgi:hypothetical protein